jgi:hypothetical protein
MARATEKRVRRTKDGTPLTPEFERELAAEAERGYDPAGWTRELVGRPSLSGNGPSPRMSFRITPELLQALERKAADDSKSVSQVARDAIARYVD